MVIRFSTSDTTSALVLHSPLFKVLCYKFDTPELVTKRPDEMPSFSLCLLTLTSYASPCRTNSVSDKNSSFFRPFNDQTIKDQLSLCLHSSQKLKSENKYSYPTSIKSILLHPFLHLYCKLITMTKNKDSLAISINPFMGCVFSSEVEDR
jgi:hypothetical protein